MGADYRYDGSFAGFLSVIFKIYESGKEPSSIKPYLAKGTNLFTNRVDVETTQTHSERVLIGLKKRLSNAGIHQLYKALLSEANHAEMAAYAMMKYAFSNEKNITTDYSNGAVLEVSKLAKMVDREVHRMHAFVRFRQTKDAIYTATIEPDFNVIPLIGDHFEKRYADQKWLIYDVKRKYGLFYDLKTVKVIELDTDQHIKKGIIPDTALDEKEHNYEKLWRDYFSSTNIKERKNRKLHLQHVPKRYWKYLPEKE